MKRLGAAAATVPLALVNDVLDELTIPKAPGEPTTKWMREADEVIRASPIQIINMRPPDAEPWTGTRAAYRRSGAIGRHDTASEAAPRRVASPS